MHSESDTELGALAARSLKATPTVLFIDGAWEASTDGAVFAVENPATGKSLTEVADASPSDALRALDAAAKSQALWAALPARKRSEFLLRAYERMIADIDAYAALITLEMGKSLTEARGEVRYAAEFLRWFSEEAVRLGGRYQRAPDGGLHHIISHKPVGPSLLITPWNFPLAMITRKVAPAIAAGCTSIVKPAELTPLTALYFAEMMRDLGLPPGVLNVVTTTNAPKIVSSLLEDPRLRKMSFTGSTRVGKILLEQAAHNVLRTSMELGGNAPFIVFEDADIDLAVEGAIQAKMRNVGQACTAANRFLVHEAVLEEFTRKVTQRVEALTVADGFTDTEVVGPVINKAARATIHERVQNAVDQGARLMTGGVLPKGRGAFYPPTVLVDVPASADILKTEIFGPILPVSTFTTEPEAITLANASELGLASYVFTKNLSRALRIMDSIEAGMLGVNTGLLSDPSAPFGGVKQSGLGREGAIEGIREYLVTQYTGLSPNQI